MGEIKILDYIFLLRVLIAASCVPIYTLRLFPIGGERIRSGKLISPFGLSGFLFWVVVSYSLVTFGHKCDPVGSYRA